MSHKITFLFADGDLTLVLNGQPFDVDQDHPHYEEIKDLLFSTQEETEEEEEERLQVLKSLVTAKTDALRETANHIGIDDVEVRHGVVYVKGEPLHNSLTERIIELATAGLPFDGFIHFLSNLSKNPSAESRDSLFEFLDQGRFPLTEDGCFLGYKGVRDYTGEDGVLNLVDSHTRKISNNPGAVCEMPWEDVDDNRNEACGAGFHVGTINHARGFGSTMVLVKVNPADCVSVPAHDTTKLRTCRYEVVAMFESSSAAEELKKPVYTNRELNQDSWEEVEKTMPAPQTENTKVLRAEANYEEMSRDDVCRMAASRGLLNSSNEARFLGKNLVIDMLMYHDKSSGDNFHEWTKQDQERLVIRRNLVTSKSAAHRLTTYELVGLLRSSQLV